LGFGLSRELWLVQAGIFLNMLGYGAVLPFELIYLHDARGFSLSVAGLVVGAVTGVAIAVAPLAGLLIDRFGARRTAVGAGIALAAGYAGLAFAHTPASALIAGAPASLLRRWSWPRSRSRSASAVTRPGSCRSSPSSRRRACAGGTWPRSGFRSGSA
jgi:MFS family permease